MAGVSIGQALALGVVEGLTEFIPVSSTGHLILVSEWLGLAADPAQKAAVDAFDIVIQAGAIAACALYYRKVFARAVRGLLASDVVEKALGIRLVMNLLAAFVPIAVVGLVARKPIKAALFNSTTVAVALVAGGVAMILAERYAKRAQSRGAAPVASVQEIQLRASLRVGLFQCLALIPGTSRSMSTILGGLFSGLNARVAADFSFLLSVPVLGAATCYEALKEWHSLTEHVGPEALAVGLLSSFVVGWASIAVFLRLLGKVGLAPFGVYRIAAGIAVFVLV